MSLEFRVSSFEFRVSSFKHYDSTKKPKRRASGGAGDRAPCRKRGGVAGAEPQQQAAAGGATKPGEPRADSHDCGGAGAASNSRTTAGTAARTPQRGDLRTRAAGGQDADVAGRGSTTDTAPRVKVAAGAWGRDTFIMAILRKRGPLPLAMSVLTLCCAIGITAQADEIRLKGGKKLYGVIVSYEENMFKVKTDFGYVLVEKDKIESIIPSTPAGKAETPAAVKRDSEQHTSKPANDSQPQAEPAVATGSDPSAAPTNPTPKTLYHCPAWQT